MQHNVGVGAAMLWFDNLSIKMKMLAVSSVMLALVLGLSLFAVLQMGVINNASTVIADNWLPSAQAVSNIRKDVDDLYIAKLQYENSTSQAVHPGLEKKPAEIYVALLRNEKIYLPLITSQEEHALYDRYLKWRIQYIKLIFSGAQDTVQDSATTPALFGAYQQVKTALEALIDFNVESASRANRHADEIYAKSRYWLAAAVIFAVVLAMLLVAVMHYRIARPIRQLADIAGKIGQGELSARSQLRYTQDELGKLAHSFDRMAEMLQWRQQAMAQADRQLSQKFDQLQAIHRLTEKINQPGTLEEVYAQAINTLHSAAHVDRVSISLSDNQGGMRFAAARGLSNSYPKRVEGYNPWPADSANFQPILIPDVEQEPYVAASQKAPLVAEGIRAVAFIPLLYQNRLLGKFMLCYNSRHDFSPEEIQLAETIASQVSFALERRRQTNQLEHQALYDNLTNIPNRSLLYDRLQQAIVASQRTGVPLTLLLIDLDRFKDINDTLGHDQGDQLLKQIGPRIQAVLRQFDTVARLGGDEFAVVLPTVSTANHAELTAMKILRSLKAPFILDTFPMEIGASIGIALYPEHGSDSDALLRCADVAMYAAKRQHTGYAMYSQQLDQHSRRQLSLISELRSAIEQNQLVLEYQPKVSLTNREFVGVEALVRWLHPQHGLIYPDQFIPEAELSELEKPLRQWVISQALQQHCAWKNIGHVIPVAVNLSARSLHDVGLPHQLKSLLRLYKASPDMLTLEITESAIMIDPVRALEVLTEISHMDIHLTIDDFGTGYSSLAYLQKLPVDTVKIDKSFVMDMTSDINNRMIVRSTIDLAHNLNISVTAEGVETQQAWLALKALNCDVVQGHYISSPIPADEFVVWLEQARRPESGEAALA